MATDKDPPCQSCTADPNYAIICSFFDKFALKCGISHFNFLELQEMLENTVEVRQPLIDLHIKLLRKARKSCSADKWERVVTKFCHSYSKQDGWELERFGYKNSRIEVKLRLLKHLLEAQFDSNVKFKSEVNKLSAIDLRVEPLGRDQNGQTYWCQFDPSCNIRIYKEDPDEESWDLIAKDRVGLVGLIDDLSSGEGQKELNSILNEDSNSLEIEKPITDTGQVSSGTSPPEVGTDESLSQEIKQYSDSTDGSADTAAQPPTKEATTNCDSDSNSRHPNQSPANPVISVKSSDKDESVKLTVEQNNTDVVESTTVQEVIKTEEVPIENKITEAKLDVIDVPNQIRVETTGNDNPKTEADRNNQDSGLNKEPMNSSLSSDIPSDLSQKQRAPETHENIKPKSDEPLDIRIPCPLISPIKVPEKIGQDSSSKIVSNNSNVCEPISLVNNVINLKSVPPSNTVVKEEEKPNKCSSVSDQNSNSSEDDASLKVSKNQPILESIKNLNNRISITKKVKGPPGSKLDEIFKFKRVHDPTTPTNLPPQSQPIPAYIGPGVKDSVLAQIKEGFGTNDTKREVTITSRSASDKCQSERVVMSSSLKERLGEITQRLSMRQIDITPMRNVNIEPLPLQAEDLTKPKPKVPEERDEPEIKKQKLNTEPEFSEAVEEPLMLVRGEGSGADCNTGNPSQFNFCDEPEFGDAIEEPMMFFFGEGSGAECDTGNPELEKNTSNSDKKDIENEDNTSSETGAESSQEKKVHKLWSIDAICNKKLEQNCEDSSKQFFFGPGSVKNLDMSDKSSEPETSVVANNNSLDQTNCDIGSTASKTQNASLQTGLDNDQPTINLTVNLNNDESDKTDLSSKINDKPIELNKDISTNINSNEIDKSSDAFCESSGAMKCKVESEGNKPKEGNEQNEVVVEKGTEQIVSVKDTELKKGKDLKYKLDGQSEEEKCENETEVGQKESKLSSVEDDNDEEIKTDSIESNITDKNEASKVSKEKYKDIKTEINIGDTNLNEKETDNKNKKHELKESEEVEQSVNKNCNSKKENEGKIKKVDSDSSNDLEDVIKNEVDNKGKSEEEEKNIKENNGQIEDESKIKKDIIVNTEDGDKIKQEDNGIIKNKEDKIKMENNDNDTNEEIDFCEKIKIEDKKQANDDEAGSGKTTSDDPELKNEDGGNSEVKAELESELNPDDNDDELSAIPIEGNSKTDEPDIQEKGNDSYSNKNKSKQGGRTTRRSSKASKEEVKNEAEEEISTEVIEPRRPRRSAAVIASQLSENIIKPRGKKPPPKKDDTKKGGNKNEPEKKVEPEKNESNVKGNKKQPVKGKKTPAKRGGSRKSSAAPEDNEEAGEEIVKEEKEHEEEQPKKTLGLNSFSFDVDASGNVPMPIIPLSRKRKLEKDKSDDDQELIPDDEDEPLAAKQRKLKGKSAKRRGKGRQRPKKKPKEPKGESDNEQEDNDDESKKSVKKIKEENSIEEKPKIKKPVTKTKTLLGLTERDLLGVEPVNTGELSASGRSVRTSRRIAQIKIKEQEEERKLHEQTLQEIKQQEKELGIKKSKKNKEKDEKKLSKRKASAKISDGDFTPYDQDSNDTLQKKKGRPRKKKEKFKYDINNPWKSSSGSGTSEEDNDDLEHYDIEDEDEDEDPRAKALVSDHEFSPESDMEKEDEGIPVRHARTALKGVIKEEVDDKACQKCSKSDHPEWILLCDKCDNGWHGSCLRPALMIVPEGDWFCPPCQHLFLVEKLKENLRLFERDSKRRENDELRRKRLAYVGISLSNVLPPPGTKVKLDDSSSESSGSSRSDDESRSGSSSDSSSYEDEPVYQLRVRRQTNQSYRFNDYDNLINSAIQDDLEAVDGPATQSRGKDIENIVEAERQEANGVNNGKEVDDDEEGGAGWRPPVVPRKCAPASLRKKSKKLTNIDVSSGDDQDSDEDFKGSSSYSEEEDSGDYSSASDGRRSKWKQPVRRSTRARTSRIDREFINDDSEDSDAPRKKKSRKVWTETESESDESWGRRKKKPSVKVSSRNRRKKKSRFSDSDSDLPKKSKSKKSKVRQVKYGLSEDEDYGRKTRGKKINYQESDSEENNALQVVKQRRVIESEDEDNYKPDPSDKKRAIVSDSEEDDDDSEEEDEEYNQDKDEGEAESDKGDENPEEKDEEYDACKQEDNKKIEQEPEIDNKVPEAVIAEPKVTPPVVPDPKVEVVKTQIIKECSKQLSDVEMFVGGVDEDEEDEEEELEEELEDEEEEDDEMEEKRMEAKINIPSPVRNLENKPEISLTIKPVDSLKSVKDKMVEEELNDELISVPGPIAKIVPVPVPASEIKESVKEVEKLDEKEEKKPDPPKVNTIRIVPQHKLMANPPPPQLEVKPIMIRSRVPGPHNLPGYPGIRYPARPPLMKHQFPSQFSPQFPPYYSQHYSEEYPSGYCPPSVHPQQVSSQQVSSAPFPHPSGVTDEGEFGGLVSYFSSQHEDNLDS